MSAIPKIQLLLNAMMSGRLEFVNQIDKRVIQHLARGERVGGEKVVVTEPVQNLLLALLNGGTVKVMSLYRNIRGGPHGERQNGEVICSAVDISAYAGLPVELGNRDRVIRVVANLIRHFPAATYDLGFPRPVGGATGYNAAQDVFFPVTDLHTAQLCFLGRISRQMNQMLQPARTQIQQAMSGSAGTFGTLYPDGLNHLHIKVK